MDDKFVANRGVIKAENGVDEHQRNIDAILANMDSQGQTMSGENFDQYLF